MNLAVKMTISGILGDFKLGKHVESPYFNQLGILVRSSTENKIMSQNPPPFHVIFQKGLQKNVKVSGLALVFKKKPKFEKNGQKGI